MENHQNKEYSFSNFKLSQRHKENSKKWLKENAKFGFEVSDNQGVLKIVKHKEKIENVVVLEKNNLTITAIDKGEWGGGLVIEDETNQVRKILEDSPIVFVYEIEDKVYFIESLSYMFLEIGIIYELSLEDYSYQKVLDLEESPCAFTIFENELYAISSYSLFKIEKSDDKEFEKIIIHKDIFFSVCCPNSMVIIEDCLYVGMRGGLAVLNYLENESNWNYYKYVK